MPRSSQGPAGHNTPNRTSISAVSIWLGTVSPHRGCVRASSPARTWQQRAAGRGGAAELGTGQAARGPPPWASHADGRRLCQAGSAVLAPPRANATEGGRQRKLGNAGLLISFLLLVLSTFLSPGWAAALRRRGQPPARAPAPRPGGRGCSPPAQWPADEGTGQAAGSLGPLLAVMRRLLPSFLAK